MRYSWSPRGSGEAAALRVPADYSSILAAVDAAVSGDSALVGPGTWTDVATRTVLFAGQSQLVTGAAFLTPGISVIAEQGAESTTVSGDETTELFVQAAFGTGAILVEGFTISGGDGLLAGRQSPIEMKSCKLVGNEPPCPAIGALGVGCGAVSVGAFVEDASWGRIKSSFR